MAAFDLRTHNGFITANNPLRGTHRTFKVHTQADDAKFAPGRRIVSLLTGPYNTSDYVGFGFVTTSGWVVVWKRYEGTEFMRLADVLNRPDHYESLGVQFNFDGRCRKCNRLLTTRESVERGLGSKCAGRA